MGRKKKIVERALALVRQGQDKACIGELERLIQTWDDLDDADAYEPSGLELDLPPTTPNGPFSDGLPAIAVNDDCSEIVISDGWEVDDEYLEFMTERLQELAETEPGRAIIADRALSLVKDGVWTKKIKRLEEMTGIRRKKEVLS